MQPRSVLKLSIHFIKVWYDMYLNWGFFKIPIGKPIWRIKSKYPKYNADFFWNLQFILSGEWDKPELWISSVPIGKLMWRKINIIQMQARFLLTLSIHFIKVWYDMYLNWGFLKIPIEKPIWRIESKYPKYSPDLFWTLKFILHWQWHEPEPRISSIPIGKPIWGKIKKPQIQPRFALKLSIHFIKVIEHFLKFQFGNQFGEKNQNTSNTTQICFKTYNSYKLGMTWTWTADFFNSNSETNLDNSKNSPNTTQICFET